METQIDLPLALDHIEPDEAASRLWPETCTEALRRVLEKAKSKGCVRRAGIYADRPQEEAAKEPEFDWQVAIDRCVAAGWLGFGIAYNTYVITPAGEAQLALPTPEPSPPAAGGKWAEMMGIQPPLAWAGTLAGLLLTPPAVALGFVHLQVILRALLRGAA